MTMSLRSLVKDLKERTFCASENHCEAGLPTMKLHLLVYSV